MKLLFCNIGWMQNYQGIKGDTLERGGEFNKFDLGHEVCNFSNTAGYAYGYVQPTGQIKIEKLGAKPNDMLVEGVTVVWTAGPPTGGTVVIGWYKNSTVYRDYAPIPKPTTLQKNNGVVNFRVSAKIENVTLLPVAERELLIPRRVKGGIGQSNVWFADKPESKNIVSRVLLLVQQGGMPPMPDIDGSHSALEGSPRLVAHLRRERDASLIRAKKAHVLKKTGRLSCEVCNFDFSAFYGDIGNEFCEIHHLKQLSKADGEVKTELKDLAVICSNCHRMIHHSNSMLTIESLIAIIKRKA